jgi:hypothetical protein
LFGGEKNGPFVQQTNKIPLRSPFIRDERGLAAEESLNFNILEANRGCAMEAVNSRYVLSRYRNRVSPKVKFVSCLSADLLFFFVLAGKKSADSKFAVC